ncbi:UDP-N-acetylmuramate dehydrogenase [Rhodococcus aerolatus]
MAGTLPSGPVVTPVVAQALAADGLHVSRDVPLAGLTTLRVGGPAAALVTCPDTASLVTAVRTLDAAGEPLLVLGGGSNLLVGDDPVAATVVHVRSDGLRLADDGLVEADAGVGWDHLVRACVEAGLGGLECLAGIPGSTGATPVQNVGAYGVEVADVLDGVELLERATGERRWVPAAELGLGYRTSVLKHTDRAVVLTVRFRLRTDGASAPLRYGELSRVLGAAPEQRLPAADVRDAVLALRRGKGMVLDAPDHDTWSAGSFFTNPVVTDAVADDVRARAVARLGPDVVLPSWPAPDGVKLSAGWLIERAGFARGHAGPDSSAGLSTKHTLALTNRGGADAAAVLALAREVRDGVHAVFGVVLEPEPVLVGCRV